MKIIKRTVDLILAILLLFIFLPLILVIALLIFFRMGHPILFTQKRIGYREKQFQIYKFRTMLDTHDAQGNLLPDSKRITRIGNILRKLSLDELPQIINILRGDLSFVGPRPLLVDYLPLYSEVEKKRHEVMPGITGWAQINGRNSIKWKEKFALDIWYVENWSLMLDFKIMIQTFTKVLSSEGVNSSTDEPMPPYNGNN